MLTQARAHRTPLRRMNHRQDIDGLRAVAVLPVVLYHLGVPGVRGGYVGVDVFFVISGFLITSIILREADAGRFSVWGFYERRARRILPALFVVIVLSYLAALWLLLPIDFRHFAQSIVATAGFGSNILFCSETGYFDSAATLKPLLHTWSLAVEEQFYLTFPLLLSWLVLRGQSRARINWLLAALALASLTLCVVAPNAGRGDAFYLPHYRAWELLLGALLACSPRGTQGPSASWAREVLASCGLVLIALPVLFYDDRTPFPGLTALPPCLGAALIIAAKSDRRGLTGRLLNAEITAGIGKISYSIYLWHWPLIVFYEYYSIGAPGFAARVVIFCATIVLSLASWRYVEQPARRVRVPRPRVFAAALAALVLLVAGGLAGHFSVGFPKRFAKVADVSSARALYNEGTCFLRKRQPAREWPSEKCTFSAGDAPQKTVVLWGDSHAAHFTPGLRDLQRRIPFRLIEASSAGCPPLLQYRDPDQTNCFEFNELVFGRIRDLAPEVVLLSARWNAFRDPLYVVEKLKRTIEAARAAGSRVLVIGESPSFAAPVPQIVALLKLRGKDPTAFNSEASFRVDDALAAALPGEDALFFSPRRLTCDGKLCRLWHASDLLYWDESHFSAAGSAYYADALEPVLERALRERPVRTQSAH
jgi:peptidoglycan/LPS O-acetylase OafA/YrhL